MLKFISSILVLVFLTTNFLWSNEIRLNELGQLIALRFFLVPGIAPIKIELL